MKRKVILLWVFICLFFICGYTLSSKSSTAWSIMDSPTIKVEERLHIQSDLGFNLHLSIPEISGLTDKDFEKTINNEINILCHSLGYEVIKLSQDKGYARLMGRTIGEDLIYEGKCSYEIKENSKGRFIIAITLYNSRLGKTHSSEKIYYYAIDTIHNKLLPMEELY